MQAALMSGDLLIDDVRYAPDTRDFRTIVNAEEFPNHSSE